ncbi:hypothetical protein ECBCE008MS01_4956 [Escherichia coli BCE008_MS-01]|nr:hypothetical protein ECMP02101712_5098 [Escherichia coli MP021017.12]ENB26669.1 hypothetical protein ECBCE008MS01_4956 [Escherichia coli BCE008_MS-01]
MCAKLIGIVEHHIVVGNISLAISEPDFEFDVYAQAEEF